MLIAAAVGFCPWTHLVAGDEYAAIEHIEELAELDCRCHPEALCQLVQFLEQDCREEVRYAAAKGIVEQLERGRPQLNPREGWRRFPDPEILTQVSRLFHGKRPLCHEELLPRYQVRALSKYRKSGEACHPCGDCCSPEVLAALARVACATKPCGSYVEPSARVRWMAEQGLAVCGRNCCEFMARPMMPAAPAPAPPAPGQPSAPPSPAPETPAAPEDIAAQPAPAEAPLLAAADTVSGFVGGPAGRGVTFLGRADMANRFNIFDNMNAVPRSRVWFGYQFVGTQNNGITVSDQNQQLFSALQDPGNLEEFVSQTGFGSFSGNAQQAIDEYLDFNAGPTSEFLNRPDTNLYRFGFEYALTPDFSIAMQAQFVQPLDDVDQPDTFSNPKILLKHVVYEDSDLVLSAMLGIDPEISTPQFAIVEDVTRINPGLLAYRQLGDRFFTQGAFGVSVPTESDQVTTIDYALGLGYWLYRHESLEPYYRGYEPTNWLLAIIPQIEFLGKSVPGDTTVFGAFGLMEAPPQTLPGHGRQGNGETGGTTRDVFIPGTNTVITQAPLFYEEPRHIVDLTAGASFLLRHNILIGAGVSVPLTGGEAREAEFLTTVNFLF